MNKMLKFNKVQMCKFCVVEMSLATNTLVNRYGQHVGVCTNCYNAAIERRTHTELVVKTLVAAC
jgi:superfamily II helicase